MGRQRSFDQDQVLKQAMLLFWEHGYETTSMADLSAVMGLKPPSIYAAFGNKEALFEKCVAHYVQNIAAYAPRALTEETTAAKALDRFMSEAITAFCTDDRPKGCLLISGATNFSNGNTGAQELLTGYRQSSETMIAERIARGVQDGDLPPSTETNLLAKYITVLIQGFAAQARDGVTSRELQRVSTLALRQIRITPQ
ncbi:MAG: AcrR family transcriptional regulator [Candidatus Azotimanducaceae bacterium]|jgi:AcrR family transcriptional regulator